VDILMAIILGIVQGITEPLPISSSGHLILVPWLLNWPDHTLTFDVALHGGTALAIIIYFWKDWVSLAKAFVASIKELDFSQDFNRRMIWYIIFACLPAAIAGVLFEEKIVTLLREPATVATLLVLMGLAMLLADYFSSHRRILTDATLWDALIIGFSQALALAPGVSRSGITITAALLLQMNRADAARFSFLLSGPIVTGAFLYKMLGLFFVGLPSEEVIPFLVGILVATLVGYAAISFLLGYLQKRSLKLFAYYRLAFGALIFALLVLR
jgi:undecaprenyl-diphosphatase